MIYLHMRKIAEFQKVCDDYQQKALITRLSETAMSTKAFGPEVAKRRRLSRDRGGYRTEYFASGWLSYFQVSKFTVIHLLPWTAIYILEHTEVDKRGQFLKNPSVRLKDGFRRRAVEICKKANAYVRLKKIIIWHLNNGYHLSKKRKNGI